MANSFKQMTKAGVIKRTDTGMFIALSDIHVREGFNKREDDERTRQADDDLFNYLQQLFGSCITPSIRPPARSQNWSISQWPR